MALEKTLYIGPFIHCQDLTTLDICQNGMIGVDEDGKIAFISRSEEAQEVSKQDGWGDAKVVKIDGTGFFFPGFIDTHIHASQYPNAGIFGKSTLLDWLNTYTFPLESSFTDLDKAARIYNRIISRTLSNGTTTACYYATIHVPATNLLADLCLSKGQRAFVGRVCMDSALSPDYYRDESPLTSYHDALACIEHVKTIDPTFSLVSPIITPRFAPSCSKESLNLLGKLHAESHVPVQTHLCENEAEIQLVKDLFPDSKHYTDVYDSAGLLTSKTILAHCCHLSADERSLIKSKNAKISHCPASNAALTSGFAPIRKLLNEGLTVGLGTDVSGGYTPSILAECREALFTSRQLCISSGAGAVKREDDVKLSVEEALFLATRGGAKVVGLEDKIGGFEVGMDWDAQMVRLNLADDELSEDVGLVDIFGHESWDDRVNKWVYGGDDRNTVAVWVKGRLVHRRRGWRG
ncbi:Putative metal-dependent hydrolase, composite domain superfamily, guanine deaminase [Septoria linicola]|uniref:Guanine deaminase n=1 Tax=Septoria linicola TaxID=215465 RepID=A0A9Q9EM74_9PEZI|nr:putative metal-dependent hydrolase, composite domain superfamily, guanine deaminase [Septoria linicola]USW55169.1 Putative metal-dependent hydrolase, composite domain superfamily, guanine deaminase [Septoria linicola]